MNGKPIEMLDSTLREGAQCEGISFSVEDKINIAKCLDSLGIDIIECGFPTGIKEQEFFKAAQNLRLKNSEFSVFCSTRHKNTKCSENEFLNQVLKIDTPFVTVFGKCNVKHVSEIIGAELDENLLMIEETCRFFSSAGKKVIFDAEHYFDGCKTDNGYTLKCLEAAKKGGASRIVLCDTNGGSFSWDIANWTYTAVMKFPDTVIGIHCHNDGDMATALTLDAVGHGATHVQGTFLGIGERCGNAPLYAVIPNLQLKMGYSCIKEESLEHLTSTANQMSEICNISLKRYEPFVGRSAFSHKAGTHIDGVIKHTESFEHISPACVGNSRRMLPSEMSGRSGIYNRVKKLYPQIEKHSPEIEKILNHLKELEFEGYQFDGAPASLDLMIIKEIGKIKPSFELVSYHVLDELPYERSCSATATIKISVNSKLQISAAEGDGPVNALDKSLRDALCFFYPVINEVHLIDYKVRVLDSKDATAATVRVLITSTDGKNIWTTVGVSSNVIEASFYALADSMEYKLHFIENKFVAEE